MSVLAPPPRIVGRYALHETLASGGMATVHLGRLVGPVGFSRTVAIKRLLPQFASDPEFVTMFLDEARLAARIRHPNVVPTLDVVATEGEIFIVMEYVHGESLARLLAMLRSMGRRIPSRIGAGILRDVLQGLHAAHDAKDEEGVPLNIVHRDVSPQNIIVGADGVARVFDFGIAKAAGRTHVTREGQLKGKLAYMAPEQLMAEPVTRATDVFAASIVFWETLTGARLFAGDSEGEIVTKILAGKIKPPSEVEPALTDRFDALVMKGLESAPARRFSSAREMAQALAKAEELADAAEVGDWLEETAHTSLVQRAAQVTSVERTPASSDEVALERHRVSDAAVVDAEPTQTVAADVHRDTTLVELSRDYVGLRRSRRNWPVTLAGALAIACLGAVLLVVGKPNRAPLANEKGPPNETTAMPSMALVASAPVASVAGVESPPQSSTTTAPPGDSAVPSAALGTRRVLAPGATVSAANRSSAPPPKSSFSRPPAGPAIPDHL